MREKIADYMELTYDEGLVSTERAHEIYQETAEYLDYLKKGFKFIPSESDTWREYMEVTAFAIFLTEILAKRIYGQRILEHAKFVAENHPEVRNVGGLGIVVI